MASLTPTKTNESSFGSLSSLPNIKAVPIRGSNLATGNTDLYTCPTGKRAFVAYGKAYNGTAGTVAHYLALKISSSYYQISTTLSTATASSAVDLIVGQGLGIILEAGEILAINCATTAGLNANLIVYEFDSSANFRTVKNVALSNGANTLYTTPSGKTASLGFTHMNLATGAANGAVWPSLSIVNGTAGSLSYALNCVPSGGSTSGSNLIFPSTALAANTSSGYNIGTNLAAGDFIVVTTSAGTAGQAAWVNVWEI